MKNEDKTKLKFNIPCDVNAEKALIACLVVDNSSIIKIMDVFSSDHFYYKIHKVIYEGILHLYNEHTPVDLFTLSGHLRSNSVFENLDTFQYINDLIDIIPTPSSISHYARIIITKYRSRSLLLAYQKIVSSLVSVNKEKDFNVLLEKAQGTIFELTTSLEKKDFTSIGDLKDSITEEIEKLYNNDNIVSYVKSGFVDLDFYIGGFQKSDLIIIAARPSMGKTALSLSMLENMALKQGKTIALFSLEMPTTQIINRLVSMKTKIDSNRIRKGKFNNKEFLNITNALSELSSTKVFIDDSGSLTSLEIRSKIKRLLFKEKVDVIIVDYLQLITSYNRRQNENRQNEISEISRSLKNLAREINLPVIVLSQLSRMVENRVSDHRPRLSDLRDSGAIEQDADLVLFIYRDAYYYPNKDDNLLGKAEIIISKHRNGPTGVVNLFFDKQYAVFRNYEERKNE